MTAPIQKLLLIDDNEADIFLCRLLIEESGLVADIETFNLAEDALTYFRKSPHPPVDAILLDIRMPRMSGFEFLECALAEFGANFSKVVVFMLTTSLDSTDSDRAKQFEIVKHYFEKPLTRAHLELIAATLSGFSEP